MLDGDVSVPVGPARIEIVNDGTSYFSDVTILGRKPGSLWLDISRANTARANTGDVIPIKQAS